MFRLHPLGVILTAASLVFISVLLSGCQSSPVNQNYHKLLEWKYSDLKLLDSIDTVIPDQDLVAAYSRKEIDSIQMRLDFLDLDHYLGKDIYIPIDTNPGGQFQIITEKGGQLVSDIRWDYLLTITASGDVEIVDKTYSGVVGAQIFIIYDSSQDRIVIDVSRSDLLRLFNNAKLEVIITSPGEQKIIDKSGTFSSDGPSPARSKVVFTFWNTFLSNTPAQTLRSWAGAHAGPMSSRHGLKYLFDAADRTHSTIFIFDLLTPNNVSALDYINVLPRIRELADKGVLGLPANGINEQLNMNNRNYSTLSSGWNGPHYKNNAEWKISTEFNNLDIKKNTTLFDLWNFYMSKSIDNYIISDIDYAQQSNKKTDCDLTPSYEYLDQPIENVSLECKKLLVSFANDQLISPLVLGGDFSKSVLGDPAISADVFSYIASHPWIQVLTIQDLLTQGNLLAVDSPFNQGNSTAENTTIPQSEPMSNSFNTVIQDKVYASLILSPPNQLTNLAWQLYYSLLIPGTPDLVSLQENYLGQIGEILTAANWAEAPVDIQSCDLDLDYDGENECILANDQVFIVIEKAGGYIPFVFTRDTKGIHQLIGPTWEFIIGLSDPSTWDAKLGVRGDFDQILGAFQDQFTNWQLYNVKISDNKIELYNDNMSMRKTIEVYPDKIHIDVENNIQSLIDPLIPLVVDPWQRYTTHWGDFYTGVKTPLGYKWGFRLSEMIGINSTSTFNIYRFNETREALSTPEDPNFDYSPGHYLPYPMALVEFTSSESLSVDIVIHP